MIRLMHSPNWRCANNYLENPFDSPSGRYIAYAKFDSTGSASSGAGHVVIAERDGTNPLILPQDVRVANQLYGAFQAWIEFEGAEYLVFADQQNAGDNEGVGYIVTAGGVQVAEFPGVPRTLSSNGRHCAHSNHESERNLNDCSLTVIDMWAGTKTAVAERADFETLWTDDVPTTWDDIGTKHPKWSPNGRYLAVTYVQEADTSLFRRMAMLDIEQEELIDLFDYTGYHHQCWHPNGYEMVMVEAAAGENPSRFVAYNVETDEWRILIPSISGSSSHGSISPDGTKVATDNVGSTMPVDIWTIGTSYPASRNRVYVSADTDQAASLHAHTQWSRDSQSIFFGCENNRIYEYRPGGTQGDMAAPLLSHSQFGVRW